MNKAHQKYKNTSIQSASPEKLLLMMYEGAIRFTKLAIKAAEEGDIAGRGMNIGRAYDIIMELNNTLDHKVGGDIAAHLEQLYIYICDQYTKANMSGDPAPLRSALNVIETLYDGWKQAVGKIKQEQAEKNHSKA